MLGKMIKHEFKATSRLYLPLFGLVALLTPVLALLFKGASAIGEKSMVGGLLVGFSTAGYIIMIVIFCIGSCLFVILRFYRTIATSEAYLTFCLPVNQHHILISKLLVGMFWQITSVVLTLLSVYSMLLIRGVIEPGQILRYIRKYFPLISAEYGGSLAMFLIQFGLIILVSTITATLSFFLAICLGQMFNEHRVLASIGMYVAIYTVQQILATVIFIPLLLTDYKSLNVGEVTIAGVEQGKLQLPTVGFFIIFAAVQIVVGVACYIASSIILKKKTNVR